MLLWLADLISLRPAVCAVNKANMAATTLWETYGYSRAPCCLMAGVYTSASAVTAHFCLHIRTLNQCEILTVNSKYPVFTPLCFTAVCIKFENREKFYLAKKHSVMICETLSSWLTPTVKSAVMKSTTHLH